MLRDLERGRGGEGVKNAEEEREEGEEEDGETRWQEEIRREAIGEWIFMEREDKEFQKEERKRKKKREDDRGRVEEKEIWQRR